MDNLSESSKQVFAEQRLSKTSEGHEMKQKTPKHKARTSPSKHDETTTKHKQKKQFVEQVGTATHTRSEKNQEAGLKTVKDSEGTKHSVELNRRKKSTSSTKKHLRQKQNQVSSNYDTIEERDTQPDDMEFELLTHLPFYKRIHNKFGFKLFIFCLLFSLDAADLFSDWLLYNDISATEEGLVYGPPETALIMALLVFSVIGTLTFIFEVTNLWLEVFRNDAWIDSDLSSAITLWIEDVPQIIINISIAACRVEAISYFQLVKAAVIIFGCVIRVLLSIIRYFGKRARHDFETAGENLESLRHVIYRVVITIGMLITLSGAITVFLFTQYERNSDGSVNFRTPHSVVKGEYEDQRYFQNVSVYFSHPLFDYDQNHHLTEKDVNWMRMAAIYDLKNEKVDGTMKIQYDQANKSKIVIWQSDISGELNLRECFEINHEARMLQNVTVASYCDNFISESNISEIVFKFHFTKPKLPELIFGDIKFNVMVKENGECHMPTTPIFNNINQRIYNTTSEANAAMHYYRTTEGISEEFHVIHVPETTDGMFYHSTNLTDIAKVWKTGFVSCASSGSLAPHLDDKIDVSCT